MNVGKSSNITNSFMRDFEIELKASNDSTQATEVMHVYNQAALHIFCNLSVNLAANSTLGLENIGTLLKKNHDYIVETVADVLEDIKGKKANCTISQIKVPKGKGEQS